MKWASCLLVAILSVGYLFIFRGAAPSWLSALLLKPCAMWLGTFHYTFLMVLIAEAIGIYKRRYRRKIFDVGPYPQYRTAFLIFIATFLLAIFGSINSRNVHVSEVELTISTNKTGYKNLTDRKLTIALVSDVHLGRLIPVDYLKYSLELLKPHNPDLLLFAGDLLDDHIGFDREELKEVIAKYTPKYGTWACLGNHEYHAGKIEESVKILEESGIRLLRDSSAIVGDSILLAGRDDYSRSRLIRQPRKELAEILKEAPAGAEDKPIILMDHQPHYLEEAEKSGVTLQVSGHTHYGQIWPANYIIDYMYENPRGLSVRGNTHYYVSSGAGTWGPPIRNTCHAEVVIIRLHFAETDPEQQADSPVAE